MSEQENVALIKKLYEAFARGDIQTILDHVTDYIKWSNPGPANVPYFGNRTGRKQVREFFDQLIGTQENVKLTIDQFVAQCDSVATLGRYTGKVKTTGKPFDSLVGHFFSIRDGKVASWTGLGDTADALAAYTSSSAADR